MTKRVFIIHGWDGYPEEGWFPWLKKQSEKKGFIVKVPSMPNPAVPKINEWIPFLKKQVDKVDKDTYFVGHSIGCQTILRYLESLKLKEEIGGVILVAAWLNLKNLSTEEEKSIAEPWIKTAINWSKVKKHTDRFVVIASDNDPFVPLSDTESFKNYLKAKVIIQNKKGHFSGSENIVELPIVLTELLRISK